MMNEPTVFSPPPAQYSSAYGPPLTIAAEKLQALQRLADAGSAPGCAVAVSDLVNEAVDDYLGEQKKTLAGIAKQAEADELERVLTTHGGEAA
jgi:hypothetical protein